MFVSMVTFHLIQPWTVEQAAVVFQSTAPKYLQLPGLRRKHYFLSEQGDRAGGIYFWDSRAAAEACYSDAWKEMVTAKYGAPPEIRFYEVPVSVDNLSGRIETD